MHSHSFSPLPPSRLSLCLTSHSLSLSHAPSLAAARGAPSPRHSARLVLQPPHSIPCRFFFSLVVFVFPPLSHLFLSPNPFPLQPPTHAHTRQHSRERLVVAGKAQSLTFATSVACSHRPSVDCRLPSIHTSRSQLLIAPDSSNARLSSNIARRRRRGGWRSGGPEPNLKIFKILVLSNAQSKSGLLQSQSRSRVI